MRLNYIQNYKTSNKQINQKHFLYIRNFFQMPKNKKQSKQDQEDSDRQSDDDSQNQLKINTDNSPKIIPVAKLPQKLKHKKIVLNVSDTQYPIITQIGEQLGWIIQDEQGIGDWDVWWTDREIEPNTLYRMNLHQKINHFPGIYVLARKNLLGLHLMGMQRKFPSQYNFFPQTFMLPMQFPQFRQYYQSVQQNKVRTYIVKPQALSQGRGIFLTRNIQDVINGRKYVVQRYLKNPLLLDGLKFDLRIYVLLAGSQPLRLYIYEQGLARLATRPYQQPTAENLHQNYIHLTNYSLNKTNPDYIYNKSDKQMDVGHKRSLKGVYQKLANLGIDIVKLKTQIQQCIIKTVISGLPSIRHQYKYCQPQQYQGNMCFHILGFDVMILDDYKPIIIEVNHTPSFQTGTPLDYQIKKGLIKDTLKLMRISQKQKKQLFQKSKQLTKKRVQTGKRDILKGQQRQKHLLQVQRKRDDEQNEILNNQQKHNGFKIIFPFADAKKNEQYKKFYDGAEVVMKELKDMRKKIISQQQSSNSKKDSNTNPTATKTSTKHNRSSSNNNNCNLNNPTVSLQRSIPHNKTLPMSTNPQLKKQSSSQKQSSQSQSNNFCKNMIKKQSITSNKEKNQSSSMQNSDDSNSKPEKVQIQKRLECQNDAIIERTQNYQTCIKKVQVDENGKQISQVEISTTSQKKIVYSSSNFGNGINSKGAIFQIRSSNHKYIRKNSSNSQGISQKQKVSQFPPLVNEPQNTSNSQSNNYQQLMSKFIRSKDLDDEDGTQFSNKRLSLEGQMILQQKLNSGNKNGKKSQNSNDEDYLVNNNTDINNQKQQGKISAGASFSKYIKNDIFEQIKQRNQKQKQKYCYQYQKQLFHDPHLSSKLNSINNNVKNSKHAHSRNTGNSYGVNQFIAKQLINEDQIKTQQQIPVQIPYSSPSTGNKYIVKNDLSNNSNSKFGTFVKPKTYNIHQNKFPQEDKFIVRMNAINQNNNMNYMGNNGNNYNFNNSNVINYNNNMESINLNYNTNINGSVLNFQQYNQYFKGPGKNIITTQVASQSYGARGKLQISQNQKQVIQFKPSTGQKYKSNSLVYKTNTGVCTSSSKDSNGGNPILMKLIDKSKIKGYQFIGNNVNISGIN